MVFEHAILQQLRQQKLSFETPRAKLSLVGRPHELLSNGAGERQYPHPPSPALSAPCSHLSPWTMKFTVSDLLDQLSTRETLAPAQLEKALGISAAEDQQKMRIGLEALERLALVEQGEEGLRRLDCP